MINMDSICVPAYWLPDFVSVGYGFLGRKAKRDEGAECEEPNAFGLGDGTVFNLTAMDEGLVKELVGLTEAKGVEDVLEMFKESQI
jgi:hypothetical protein